MKRIYFFGNGKAEGDRTQKELLGGKGANLAEMSNIGIAVPPGFTITTKVCAEFYENDGKLPSEFDRELDEMLQRLEGAMGKKFGDVKDPLLVSVRSGAPISMPGMMDTILNLGLNQDSIQGLIEKSKNERFAWDTYRRLIQMFGNVVLKVSGENFEEVLEKHKEEAGVKIDAELNVDFLKKVVSEYKEIVQKETGSPFPDDPRKQLRLAIEAVFKSWHTPRAVKYRQINHIPENLGTAVNVQAMVFGNRGESSATGVAFSRNPSNGNPGVMGEFLVNAQGEDVVAGIRTPNPLNERSKGKGTMGKTLEEVMPKLYKEFDEYSVRLEKHYKDMQDIEFTIEDGKLWILQTRNGKRTAASAIEIAVEMVKEGMIDEKTAVTRVAPAQIDQLLHPIFDPKAEKKVMATGLAASPGAVSGKIVFTANDAEAWHEKGEKVILVRNETSPEDIHGMVAAEGILTARGGMTSHAAVVARGMGKCCVVGCSEINVRVDDKTLQLKNGEKLKEGDIISLDGSSGEVLQGSLPTVKPELGQSYKKLMTWVDEFRKLRIRTNADTPADSQVARDFGAEGIGLCRTEHMFFDKERIDVVRQMILSKTSEERRKHLDKILPMQLQDFKGIFKAMKGLPVTIRLLDPPLHEFLPHTTKEIQELSSRISVSEDELRKRIDELHESNPMLGHRGCRLAITYPEIYDMQAQAIMTAACEVDKEVDEEIPVEIMVPLVIDPRELQILRDRIVKIAEDIKKKFNSNVKYMVGTMIEIPRAALMAETIARDAAEFFSFGTNDLTQTTLGLSRDDSGRFLPEYVSRGIFENDPFSSVDPEGVLELVQLATERGRKGNSKLKVGICGEHGGDPNSIHHFHRLGFNYVSCSPYRVPVARLAAAHAAIKNQ